MLIKIKLTEEHLKLIPFIYLQEEGDNEVKIDRTHLFCLGSHLMEDMAMILGYEDKAIEGTENDPEGRAYPDDVEEHMLGLYSYMRDNLFYVESLVHYYATKGGLTEGTYKCRANELLWEKE